jgi:GAF domain-containing protein
MDGNPPKSDPTQPNARANDEKGFAALNNLGSRLAVIQDLGEGLDEILAAVIQLLRADKGNIQLLDAERGILTIAVHRGFEQSFLDTFKSVSTIDETACGRALRLRRSIVIADIETDPAFARFRAAARAAGYRAVISAPIIWEATLFPSAWFLHTSLTHTSLQSTRSAS